MVDALSNQVQVRLASSPLATGSSVPVFSVSRQSSAGASAQVNISAAARALAGVSGLAAGAQLQLFVQYVGAFGGSGRSFSPFSPAQTYSQRFAADPGQSARAEAVEAALDQRALEQQAAAANAAAQTASQASPGPAAPSSVSAPAPAANAAALAAYQGAQAGAPGAGGGLALSV